MQKATDLSPLPVATRATVPVTMFASSSQEYCTHSYDTLRVFPPNAYSEEVGRIQHGSSCMASASSFSRKAPTVRACRQHDQLHDQY